MIQNVLALVFAGSKTSTLTVLEKKRTNAAIPFGGIYRLIDFSMSNLANSELRKVGIFTQYRPLSLMEHLHFGKPWDLVGRTREVIALPPYTGEVASSWYKGTADAIYQNIDFVKTSKHDHVLFLSGEDVYKFDFKDLYNFHKSNNADVTIVGNYVENKDLSRFGIISADYNNVVKNYEEKPKIPKSNLVYISIAIFKKEVLLKALKLDAEDKNSTHSFSSDILSKLINKQKVYVYINKNPWNYIGNIEEYWEANMMMLTNKPKIIPEDWGIRTNINDRNTSTRTPFLAKPGSNIKNSIISKGCVIEGEVTDCILSPGVIIKKGAKVKRSIIMHDSYISEGCDIDMTVLDKDVYLEKNVKIGVGKNIPNKEYPAHYSKGITVLGKAVKIPRNIRIGKNCLIYSGIPKSFFTKKEIKSGETLQHS